MAVLVVDDDATVVNLVTAVLHRAGIDAEVALDGPGALQRLSRGRYRAVLSDLTMPGMSGLQLLREARARGHSLPFLIMTAYLPPEAQAALRDEPGVAGVLRKPFDIRRLVDEVTALLRSAGVEPAAAAAAALAPALAPMPMPAILPAPAPEPALVPAPVPVPVLAPAAVAATVTDDAVLLADDVQPVAALSIAPPIVIPRPFAPAMGTAVLPLSLPEYVTARMRRQALIALAERRAAALLARPAPLARAGAAAVAASAEAPPLRQAEQGC
ncbi:MAG TPA: response regulator [Planctomycetota bacterium]|nr:response regulator [Planctomycetota bacterium]